MTKSQEKTVKELSVKGWKYLDESTFQINRRNYSVVRMINDGRIVTINFRGGFTGLATSLAKQ